jgi:hypothetical protein
MYPIHMSTETQTKSHIRAAASRFAKHHRRYPQWVQQKIRSRLDAAKRAHGIGEYRRKKVVSLAARRRKAARVRRAA